MENEKLKVGVIGVGALGRHHARLYAQSPNAEVVGIFDVQKETAEKVGAEFNLKVFEKWEELAEKCDISRNSVSLIETGKLNPTIIKVIDIAKSLNVDINVLIKDI